MFLLRQTTLVSIVITTLFSKSHAVLENEEGGNFLSARVSMIELTKQLLAPLGVLLKAAVEEANDYLPDKQLSESSNFGTCCEFGDVGAKLETKLFEFELEEVREDEQIDLRATPDGNDKSIVKVSSVATDLRIASGMSTTVGVAAIIPFTCEIGSTVEIIIDRYAVDFDVDLRDDRTTVNVHMAEIDEGSAIVKVTPILKGLCEAVEGPVMNVFEDVSNSLTVMFRNVFSQRMTDLIIEQLNVAVEFLLPDKDGIHIDLSSQNFLPGRSLTIAPRLESLSGGLISTDWSTSASLKAFLSEPAWREGFSFDYEDYFPNYDSLTMPQPNLDHAFNLHLGEPALNKFMTSLWYLGWSKVADEEVVDGSCDSESMDTDPCPFPPSQRTVSFFNFEFYALFMMYPLRMFTAFDLRTFLSPPHLKFVEEGMSGRGTVSLSVQGRRGLGEPQPLATVRTNYNARGSLPGFDFDTGRISILKLDELFFDELDIEFVDAPVLSRLTTLFVNVGAQVLRAASTLLLDFVNGAVEKALNELPTLLLPDMDAFPIVSGVLHFYLPVGGMRAVPAGDDNTASYVEIWGDLGTRTLSSEDDKNDGDDENGDDSSNGGNYYSYYSKTNVFVQKDEANPVVRLNNYCDIAKQWAQESDNYLASFSCTYSGKSAEEHMTFESGMK